MLYYIVHGHIYTVPQNLSEVFYLKTRIGEIATGFTSKFRGGYKRISFINRIKILIALLLIPVVIFFSMPFIGTSAEISISGGMGKNSRSIELVSPNDEIIGFSVYDIISNHNISQFKLFGTKIGDYNLFGVSLYDLITTPIPNYGVLDRADVFINSKAAEFLNNGDVKKFILENLGDIGDDIVALMESASLYLDDARTIIGTAQNIFESISNASHHVRTVINSINTVLAATSAGFTIMPLLLLIGVLLLLIKRPTYAPAVLFTVLFGLLLVLGIAVAISNNIVTGHMNQINSEVNSSIMDSIASAFPDVSGILSILGVGAGIFFGVYIYCGWAYYLILIITGIMAALSYYVAIYGKRHGLGNTSAVG